MGIFYATNYFIGKRIYHCLRKSILYYSMDMIFLIRFSLKYVAMFTENRKRNSGLLFDVRQLEEKSVRGIFRTLITSYSMVTHSVCGKLIAAIR